MPTAPVGIPEPDKVQQAKETEAGAEISALVNYVQPVHFSSFENSESKFSFVIVTLYTFDNFFFIFY